MSVMFKDKRRNIDINPFLIRWAQAEEEAGGEDDEGVSRGSITLAYGNRFTLNELSEEIKLN